MVIFWIEIRQPATTPAHDTVTSWHRVFRARPFILRQLDGSILPTRGAVYAAKGYCTAPARQADAQRRCHLAAIHRRCGANIFLFFRDRSVAVASSPVLPARR
ncbi:MAG: hypothetical protein H0X47_09895 [Nitrospirales bacterium]|nr:hypothetical protein [Nitrospirales bacterium]